jgi:hypothetical protein
MERILAKADAQRITQTGGWRFDHVRPWTIESRLR